MGTLDQLGGPPLERITVRGFGSVSRVPKESTAGDGDAVRLSNGEFSLLVVLLGSPHRILSRDQLLDMSHLHNDDVYNRSVNCDHAPAEQ
jgi:DNA-binding response OmpR family regulator